MDATFNGRGHGSPQGTVKAINLKITSQDNHAALAKL